MDWDVSGSGNHLSPARHQAINCTNTDFLLIIGPQGINFSEIRIKIQKFLFKKTHLKILPAIWHTFFAGLYVWHRTVCTKKYAQGLCFVALGDNKLNPFRVTSLALGQSYDFLSASEPKLGDMDTAGLPTSKILFPYFVEKISVFWVTFPYPLICSSPDSKLNFLFTLVGSIHSQWKL